MANYSLYLSVTGGQISSGETLLAADSVEYVTAVFRFDDSWNDLLKTATFRTGELVYSLPLEEDCCQIPYEALRSGILYISVYGVSGTTRATTTELPIQVEKSGYTPCVPSAPAADPYNYFLEQVTALKQQATQSAEESSQAAETAGKASTSAEQAMTQAVAAAESAAQDSQAAVTAQQSAQESASAAASALWQAGIKADVAEECAAAAATSASYAQNTVLNELETHNAADNSGAHPNLVQLAAEAKAIALGKAASLSFADKAQLDAWLDGSYTRADGKTVADLKVGDNLYIIALGVPDYWWDGSTIQPLGAEKPDLTDYYTKAQIDGRLSDLSFRQMSRSSYDALAAADGLTAGTVYFVYEEE